MKTKHILIALAMIAALSMVSCKNNNSQEPTQEDVQEMKLALTDSLMAVIDEIAENDIVLYGQDHNPLLCVLTDEEKLVKPDYLLDLNEIGTLVTRQQKINALGILTINYVVRSIYDMPLEETQEAMGRLAVDLNIPFNTNEINGENLSDKCRNTYETLKANGDLDLYWNFQRAMYVTSNYILSKDTELFFGKISQDVWDTFSKRAICLASAIVAIASADPTFMPEATVELYRNYLKVNEYNPTLEGYKQYYNKEKDAFEMRYKSLLQ